MKHSKLAHVKGMRGAAGASCRQEKPESYSLQQPNERRNNAYGVHRRVANRIEVSERAISTSGFFCNRF